jgi:hypothetical protein
MDITSALDAAKFYSLTGGVALDELLAQQDAIMTAADEFLAHHADVLDDVMKRQFLTVSPAFMNMGAAVAGAIHQHAQQWQSTMDLADRLDPSYMETAMMAATAIPEPPRFEISPAKPVLSPLLFSAFNSEPQVKDELRRTIVRRELKRRIGFNR